MHLYAPHFEEVEILFNSVLNHKSSIPVDFGDCLEEESHLLANLIQLGPVVQSIISLTSPLRGQLVKCFTAL